MLFMFRVYFPHAVSVEEVHGPDRKLPTVAVFVSFLPST